MMVIVMLMVIECGRGRSCSSGVGQEPCLRRKTSNYQNFEIGGSPDGIHVRRRSISVLDEGVGWALDSMIVLCHRRLCSTVQGPNVVLLGARPLFAFALFIACISSPALRRFRSAPGGSAPNQPHTETCSMSRFQNPNLEFDQDHELLGSLRL